jgi:hypothetical protein
MEIPITASNFTSVEDNQFNSYLEIPDDIEPQSFIESNMIDDPTFEKILVETESKPIEIPSCRTLDEYIFNSINLELANIIKNSIENYNNIVLPNYRKKLREWYFKNHPEIIERHLKKVNEDIEYYNKRNRLIDQSNNRQVSLNWVIDENNEIIKTKDNEESKD